MKNIILSTILILMYLQSIAQIQNNTYVHISGPNLPLDSDGDGIPDNIEGFGDLDNDGIPNYLDLDSDGDGVLDSDDLCYFVVGSPPDGCLHEKTVFWVHGYQGNENSFSKVADYVENTFTVNSVSPDYNSSQQSLQASADNVKNDIENQTYAQLNTEDNFIIAHSMGGIVVRKMGELENSAGNPRYNGFITFGSPHQGVFAANTLVNNPQLLTSILTDACSSLAAGPVAEGISNTGILGRLLVNIGYSGGILNNPCGAAVSVGFPLALSFASTGVENELTTASVENLASMPTEHKATFYGIEDGQSDGSYAPRMIGSILSPPNDFSLWGAGDSDEIGIAEVSTSLTFYINKRNLFNTMHQFVCIFGGSFACWMDNNDEISDAYNEGVTWFTTLDPSWKEVMGATQTEVIQTGCGCDIFDFNGGGFTYEVIPGEQDCTLLNEGWWIDCSPVFSSQIVSKDADGFILAESAKNGPGMNCTPRLMDGSNHFQMRNDMNTRDAIEKIFDTGLGGAGDFFITDKR